MSDNRQNNYSFTVAPLSFRDIDCAANGFYIERLSGVDFVEVSFKDDGSDLQRFEPATGYEFPYTFKRVRIYNPDAVNTATGRCNIYNGKKIDNRFSFAGDMKIDTAIPLSTEEIKSSSISHTLSQLNAGMSKVIAPNASRKWIIIQNLSCEVLRIRESYGATLNGYEIKPFDEIKLETTSQIRVVNMGTVAIKYLTLEGL